ncbi:MAG TPA: PEP-CTERM sorting domain-containing protein [Tepidisphaeraceae bacterium]
MSHPLLGMAALTALAAPFGADAGLVIDVQAFSKNGHTLDDPKGVLVAPGDTIIFRVYAQVTGADDTLPECFQSLTGSFLSSGATRGDLRLNAAGITAPFGASGSSGGQQADLDGDGDLDMGSNNDADPAGYVAVRAAQLIGPALDHDDFHPPPRPIPGGWAYRIISNLRLNIASVGNGPTAVNFRPRISNTGGFWSLDATEIVTDNGDGTSAYSYTGGHSFTDTSLVQAGEPVMLLPVPEPAALGLAVIAGLGLLARRRDAASQ